uniref:probable BOI-related E3 ubiquitin-protein ligase 2 n=1 Tax=Erigeron canadensis TaxID=72917 RepID=UPI001CB988A6|nr:probable BOI-related E3 ubiquitin-protein ligase 2 [Erigeron canadensis]
MMIDKYDSGIMTPAIKTDSGLTSVIPVSRKLPSSSLNQPIINLNQHLLGSFMFLNQDISSQMYQQQLEIDQFITHHTENARRQIEEMRKRNSKRLIEAAQQGIMKRLKTKEEEITKMGQLNHSLQEKVKTLTLENQIWMELAQTNEATANTLRNNLQQVLNQLQLQQDQQHDTTNINNVDDTQSSCYGSNYENNKRWLCWKCRKKEACVLLLPCRHLCVCNVCDDSGGISICPVCKSTKSAGVHVNMTTT